jgi:hypothetical protein
MVVDKYKKILEIKNVIYNDRDEVKETLIRYEQDGLKRYQTLEKIKKKDVVNE